MQVLHLMYSGDICDGFVTVLEIFIDTEKHNYKTFPSTTGLIGHLRGPKYAKYLEHARKALSIQKLWLLDSVWIAVCE